MHKDLYFSHANDKFSISFVMHRYATFRVTGDSELRNRPIPRCPDERGWSVPDTIVCDPLRYHFSQHVCYLSVLLQAGPENSFLRMWNAGRQQCRLLRTQSDDWCMIEGGNEGSLLYLGTEISFQGIGPYSLLFFFGGGGEDVGRAGRRVIQFVLCHVHALTACGRSFEKF